MSGERGSVLVISLVLLLAFTLVILGSGQQLLVEQRIGGNQSDRQKAFQLAQLTLAEGEKYVDTQNPDWSSTEDIFSAPYCDKGGYEGLCSKDGGDQPAWERKSAQQPFGVLHPCGKAREYASVNPQGKTPIGCNKGKVTPGTVTWANPRYIVELLDDRYSDPKVSGRLYRITARAWGKNQSTQVTLQSHYVVPH